MNLQKYRRAFFAIPLAALWFGAASAGPKPDVAGLETGPVVVNTTPITSFARFGGADTPSGKLTFRGGLVLTSPSSHFGGWSGLVVDDEAKSFLALSDTGVWMTGTLTYDGTRPSGIVDARLGPLPAKGAGSIRRGRDRDSESIALESGTLEKGSVLIGFERRHRIERYDLTSAGIAVDRGTIPLPKAAGKMRANQGLEAMTVMKGGPYKGSLVAFSERLYDPSRNHTGWLWTAKGPEVLHLKNIDDYDLTDLSSLDDGTLFVLERRFRWTEGVKMRLRRLAPDELKPGVTAEGETLIEADLNDNIDNMEGLSVTRLKSGEVLVTMMSDDNFNHILQRNVLLQFTVNDGGQAKARLQN